jgi:flagella basal body P-ring formation protein FlgA
MMGSMRILLRISFLAGAVAILSGNAYSATNATAIRPILVPEGTTSVRIDRKALDVKVSSLLDVIPGSLSYTHLPGGFPVGNPLGIRGEVQVEGRDDRITHLALLVKRGQVVKEMFYFTVRMKRKVRTPGPDSGQSIQRAAGSVGGGIQSGDTVRIQAVGNGFVISLTGIAQESGQTGDRIAVFNPMSGARVQGTVVGPDRVRIRLKGSEHALD